MHNLNILLEDYPKEVLDLFEDEQAYLKLPPNLIKDTSKVFSLIDTKHIHKEKKTALELIYKVLSNFTFVKLKQVHYKDRYVSDNYINLSSRILAQQVGTYKCRYRLILDLLIEEGFIEKGLGHKLNVKCTSYKLNDKYSTFNVEKYYLKSSYVIKLHRKNMRRSNLNIFDSTIAKNELLNMHYIEMPSIEEVEEHLKSKSKKRKTLNKNGKQLKVLGKKKRDNDKYVYVEDYLDLYRSLNKHLKIPKVLSERAGHRVMTNINMCPSIIRELIKVDGKPLVSLDFGCFQPNIANHIYGEELKEPLSHEKIADKLGIDDKKAKTENLSFFNKECYQMERSKLWDYYNTHHHKMLDNITKEKQKKGYKSPTRKLFSKEVEIMTEIVKRCMESGIIVVYIFDELLCEEEFKDDVRSIMEEVCEEKGLKISIK